MRITGIVILVPRYRSHLMKMMVGLTPARIIIGHDDCSHIFLSFVVDDDHHLGTGDLGIVGLAHKCLTYD